MKKALLGLMAVGFMASLTSCDDDRKCRDPGKCYRNQSRYEADYAHDTTDYDDQFNSSRYENRGW